MAKITEVFYPKSIVDDFDETAKDILKTYGAPVSSGVVIFSEKEISTIINQLKLEHKVTIYDDNLNRLFQRNAIQN